MSTVPGNPPTTQPTGTGSGKLRGSRLAGCALCLVFTAACGPRTDSTAVGSDASGAVTRPAPLPEDTRDPAGSGSLPSPTQPLGSAAAPSQAAASTTAPAPEVTASSTPETEPVGVPREGRLITRVQYEATIRDLFDGLVQGPFTAQFPSENEVNGFGTDARSHRASSWLVEAHLLAAESVSAKVLAVLPRLLPCTDVNPDDACALGFIQETTNKAFRRPASEVEFAPIRALFEETYDSEGFDTAIAMSLEAILQSPQFLYRLETSQELVGPDVYRVSDWEMASRLSTLFWNSIPDTELQLQAAAGQLHEPNEIEQQARRLAADPRTRETLLDFASQWLGVYKIDSIARQTSLGTATELNAAWKASLGQFAVDSLWGADGGTEKLMLSPKVFLDETLARAYGVGVPTGTVPGALFSVDMTGQRFGLVTQPGLLALLAHPDQTAPSQRGYFVRERLLCQPPPPPPPMANPTPPDPDPNLTTRERFLVHTQQPDCAGCHRMFDGIGLSLEGFDQAGAFRATENGLELDLTGEVYGTFDKSIAGTYVGPEELARRLAGSYQVRDCLVMQWYRYSMGRYDETLDQVDVKAVSAAADAAGGGFAEIMVQLSLSDAFRFRQDTPVNEELSE